MFNTFKTVNELRKEMMLRKKVNAQEATILTMLLAETLNTAKADKNREATEKDIVTAIKRMHKMAEQSKALNVQGADFEVEFLAQYLPKVLREETTRGIVSASYKQFDGNVSDIMKSMKMLYGDTIDMKLVSNIIKELQK